MSEIITVDGIIEKVYFDEKTNEALYWVQSIDNGKTWRVVDCSMYPNGKPPFIRFCADKEWDVRYGTL